MLKLSIDEIASEIAVCICVHIWVKLHTSVGDKLSFLARPLKERFCRRAIWGRTNAQSAQSHATLQSHIALLSTQFRRKGREWLAHTGRRGSQRGWMQNVCSTPSTEFIHSTQLAKCQPGGKNSSSSPMWRSSQSISTTSLYLNHVLPFLPPNQLPWSTQSHPKRWWKQQPTFRIDWCACNVKWSSEVYLPEWGHCQMGCLPTELCIWK